MNYWDLERLGRVRLSENFFMREFLYSEVANYHRISNIPVYPNIAIQNGKRLCEQILEPLQKNFGRLYIRSGYRSPAVNQFCSDKGLGCKSNEKNYARHIWDFKDAQNRSGAMSVVVVPSFIEEYQRTRNKEPLENWITDNIEHSELIFFKNLAAFNIGWRE
jgi:hypothetical protein